MTSANTDLMTYLAKRRSIPAQKIGAPAPSQEELDAILTVSARVPDHGKLEPWRFIVVGPEDRATFSDKLVEIWRKENPDADEEAVGLERRKRSFAPMIVVVVAKAADHAKIPVWEQHLSAGAVCTNMIHAANAAGYTAQWLTGWPTYDGDVASLLGLAADEKIAGFMHIGTPEAEPVERPRPNLPDLISTWTA